MPINESSNNLRSNDLTPAQERAMQAAAYGLPDPGPQSGNFSHEDIARLRMILAQHDAQQTPVREFDLNRPPRDMTLAPGTPNATGPYQYQAFPRILYQHEERAWRLVQNQAQMEMAMQQGWRIDPYPTEPPDEPELDDATQAEVAAIDRQLKKKKGQQQQ